MSALKSSKNVQKAVEELDSHLVEMFTSANGRPPTDKAELDGYKGYIKQYSDSSAVLAPPRKVDIKGVNNCMILSNGFENHEEEGYRLHMKHKIDETNISKTFTWLNFNVEKESDLTRNEMQQTITEISKNDYQNNECFVLFLLSHGNEMGGIESADGKLVEIDWIINKLANVKTLQGKPKLIFVQACRGDEPMEPVEIPNDLKAAGSKTIQMAKKADIFVFYSTTQGNTAWLGSKQGSFFISKLCMVLQQYCGMHHLNDIATKVNDIISTHIYQTQDGYLCQVSEIRHTLTSNLYFHPKVTFKEFESTYNE